MSEQELTEPKDHFLVARRLGIGLIILCLVAASAMTFTVMENERVVLVRLGKPIRVVSEAGFHWRLPWPVETVHRLDARTAFLNVRISETLTRDKRNVILPVFAAWQVTDPLQFLKAVGDRQNAESKLDAILTSARNQVLGQYEYHQLVSTTDGEVKLAEIENQIRALANHETEKNFGAVIHEVGIKQLSLPEANTEYVFRRMRAERARVASQFRAEGRKEAAEIRAKTDSERTRLLADAKKYAAETRGKAEAEASRIYAEAHSKDPEFYQFLRELQALRHIVDRNTTLVLDMDAAPFRMLKGETLEAASAKPKSDLAQAAEPTPAPQPTHEMESEPMTSFEAFGPFLTDDDPQTN